MHEQRFASGARVASWPRCAGLTLQTQWLLCYIHRACCAEQGTAVIHTMSTDEIRSRVTETKSFAALLHSQFLLDEPWLSRTLFHACYTVKHSAGKVRSLEVILPPHDPCPSPNRPCTCGHACMVCSHSQTANNVQRPFASLWCNLCRCGDSVVVEPFVRTRAPVVTEC